MRIGTKVNRKMGQKERGQSMVELALILPFLILLLAATVEAGFALRDYLMVQSVSREGARWAVRTPPDDNTEHFDNDVVPEVFDRMIVAAEEGGLQPEYVQVILTHIYVDDSGAAKADPDTYYATFAVQATRIDPSELAASNAAKEAQINNLRLNNGQGPLRNEVVVVEVFYKHETVWGFESVGAFGADWIMYAQSSMRMVGTGND